MEYRRTYQVYSYVECASSLVMEGREAARSAATELGQPDLKPDIDPEQLEVVEMFVKRRDVLAVLPTGYGKSLCFGCLPPVFLNRLVEKKTASLL